MNDSQLNQIVRILDTMCDNQSKMVKCIKDLEEHCNILADKVERLENNQAWKMSFKE